MLGRLILLYISKLTNNDTIPASSKGNMINP